MRYRSSVLRSHLRWRQHPVLLALIAVTLYPLLYVLFASVSDATLLAHNAGSAAAARPQSHGLQAGARQPDDRHRLPQHALLRHRRHRAQPSDDVLAAYGLSRKNVFWRNPILFLIIFTMFFSGGMIPTYPAGCELGMLNKAVGADHPAGDQHLESDHHADDVPDDAGRLEESAARRRQRLPRSSSASSSRCRCRSSP